MTGGDLEYMDDYVPKNILLTGGAGFIGSHVAILLITKYPAYKVRRFTAGEDVMGHLTY
jgi:UDP-glucose 4,6-dehydratase